MAISRILTSSVLNALANRAFVESLFTSQDIAEAWFGADSVPARILWRSPEAMSKVVRRARKLRDQAESEAKGYQSRVVVTDERGVSTRTYVDGALSIAERAKMAALNVADYSSRTVYCEVESGFRRDRIRVDLSLFANPVGLRNGS